MHSHLPFLACINNTYFTHITVSRLTQTHKLGHAHNIQYCYSSRVTRKISLAGFDKI